MKHQRWENKDYLKFISEMPCANCQLKDGTVVPHHSKGGGPHYQGEPESKPLIYLPCLSAMNAIPRYTMGMWMS